MTFDAETEALRAVPLFAGIAPKRLKLLALASERLSFAAGQTLFAEGEAGDAAYVILEGRAEVVAEGVEGAFKIAEAGRHDIVGEIAILAGVPRTATVIAITDVVALKVSKELFLALIGESPKAALALARYLARRLEETTGRLRAPRAGS